MWINNRGYMQERITDPHTGLPRIISVKCSGNSMKARDEAYRQLQDKIKRLSESEFRFFQTIDVYLSEMQKEWKPSTYSHENSHFKQIKKILGDAYMNKLTAGYIRTKFIESGKNNHTLNDYQYSIKAFWRWAYRNDFVKSLDVADKLSTFRDTPKKERIQDKYLETFELKKLLTAMADPRYKLLSKFMVLTGMRIGEVQALEDCDVWGSIIRINKTYDRTNRIVTAPKSIESKREIHVQPELKECIDQIREYKKVIGYKGSLFFPDANGKRLDYSSYNDYLELISLAVLNRKITPHIFRHTHCSVMVMSGLSYEAIMARLGHGDSKVTKQIYTHRLQELKDKENRQMDSIKLLS